VSLVKRALPLYLVLLVFLAIFAATAQENPSQGQTSSPTAKTSHAAPGNSAADIAAAKAAHKVWVNLDTGIYHKGGRWYGKTKNGKFMTEDEARKSGYKAARRD
jgi:hypothetical protein